MKTALATGMLLTIALAGCDWFEEAEVPTYIYIEKFDLHTESISQGTDSELITDAWIYLDDKSLGVYELPARVPVLADEESNLKIFPGVKLDGVTSKRKVNPFYSIHEQNFVPNPATVDTIVPSITYRSNVTFPLIENFEQGNDFSNKMSRTSIQSEVFEGDWSGVVHLDEQNPEMATASFQYDLPTDGSRIFLELNYKNTARFNVNVLANNLGSNNLEYAVTVNPKEEWHKIYVDLTEEVNANSAVNFNLVFSGNLPEGASEASFYFDNIKIMHF